MGQKFKEIEAESLSTEEDLYDVIDQTTVGKRYKVNFRGRPVGLIVPMSDYAKIKDSAPKDVLDLLVDLIHVVIDQDASIDQDDKKRLSASIDEFEISYWNSVEDPDDFDW